MAARAFALDNGKRSAIIRAMYGATKRGSHSEFKRHVEPGEIVIAFTC